MAPRVAFVFTAMLVLLVSASFAFVPGVAGAGGFLAGLVLGAVLYREATQ